MTLAIKYKKWLGYLLYVIAVTLVLLYYLFPAQAVEEFIDNSVSRINPDLGFSAANIGPWLPAGLRINTGRVYLQDGGGPAVFTADSLYIGPRILKLLQQGYSIDLAAAAYRGDIRGVLHVRDEAGEILESELTLKDLDIAAYEFLTAKLPHQLTGKLSGDIVYARDSANAAGGSGNADMRLTDGQLQLQNPVFGINSVDLRNIDLELELRGGEITITRAELAGTEVKGSITGSIQLQPDIRNSRLNLRGTLEPLAEFYKNYPEVRELLKSMRKRVRRGEYSFTVNGTLGNPQFRLL